MSGYERENRNVLRRCSWCACDTDVLPRRGAVSTTTQDTFWPFGWGTFMSANDTLRVFAYPCNLLW